MSSQRDELESLSRAFAARSQSLGQQQCPAPEQLFEAVSGNLDRERRMQIIDHVSECAECSEAWRLAMELGARTDEETIRASTSQVTQIPTELMSGSRGGVWKFAMAASVIVSVGLLTHFALREDETPQYRDVIDSIAPKSLVSDGLPRDQFVLRWSPGPAGSTYTVRLSTQDLAVLLEQQDIYGSEFLVPSAALEGVASGEQVLWQVEARLPDGKRLSSETFVVAVE